MLTGSVSRGAADEVSDLELLVVTAEPLELATCFEHAGRAGLEGSTPGARRARRLARLRLLRGRADRAGLVAARASPRRRWPRCSRGGASLGRRARPRRLAAHDRPARRAGRSSCASTPAELAAARIEEAALTWGGYAPEGMLTLTRPGERLALVERMVDDATRVLQILYALNRVWPPTDQAGRRAGRGAFGKARPAGRAHRAGAHRARPVPRAARAERAAARNGRARAERPERRPRPRLARAGAGSAPGRIAGG